MREDDTTGLDALVAAGPPPPTGWSHAELTAWIADLADKAGPGEAFEVPLSGALWPDTEMFKSEEEALISALRALPPRRGLNLSLA